MDYHQVSGDELASFVERGDAVASGPMTDTTAPQAPRIPLEYEPENAVEEAVGQRRSLRGFLDTPVPMETVKRILSLAARAPSGTNTQPWRVRVLTGEAKSRLSNSIMKVFDDGGMSTSFYKYYPDRFPEPYLSRRRKVGWDLYGLLGIGKGDFEKTHAQHGRNYTFFDAPVALMFSISRELEIGSWLDYGMFLQNVMILARSHGLETCPQAAFAPYNDLIAKELDFDEEEVVVCGISIGYADWGRIENTLITEREPLDGFVQFMDE